MMEEPSELRRWVSRAFKATLALPPKAAKAKASPKAKAAKAKASPKAKAKKKA